MLELADVGRALHALGATAGSARPTFLCTNLGKQLFSESAVHIGPIAYLCLKSIPDYQADSEKRRPTDLSC